MIINILITIDKLSYLAYHVYKYYHYVYLSVVR